MRKLFLSEQRHIHHMMKVNVGVDWSDKPSVVDEYHCEPRRPVRGRAFNADYVLLFIPANTLPPEYRCFCARVLPYTMGAEVFLTVDVATGQPVRTELIAGEAFQLKDFRPHVERLERALADLGVPLQLKRCKDCRMFVIENEICFLVYPAGRTDSVGSPTVLRRDRDAEIHSYCSAGQVLCVDGWLRTEVELSDRYLDVECVDNQ